MIFGIDCFSGYGLIDWKKAAAGGVRFAWAQCIQGNEPRRNDPTFTRNVADGMSAGVAMGAYAFAYPLPYGDELPAGRSPLEQAERFYLTAHGLGSREGELSPALDLEWPPPNEWGKWSCTAQQISDWARDWCEHAERLFGRLPVIYTYPWFWGELAKKADVSWAARYPLWMASYTHAGPGIPPDGKAPMLPAPWRSWAAWQYSADGSSERVPGVPACPVDRDCMRDEETFQRLTGREAAPPAFAVVYPLPDPAKPPPPEAA